MRPYRLGNQRRSGNGSELAEKRKKGKPRVKIPREYFERQREITSARREAQQRGQKIASGQ
jgi:hypothetical protein